MLTFFCPKCWATMAEGQATCPNCGTVVDEFSNLDYEDKLLAALYHSVAERKIMAAQILGNRGSQRALPEFLKIITGEEKNYYFLRAILLAAAKIDHPLSATILQQAARNSSAMISRLANELLAQLADPSQQNMWDRNTG